MGKKKDKIIPIRLNDEQYESIKKEADKLRVPYSMFMRNCVLDHLERSNGK